MKLPGMLHYAVLGALIAAADQASKAWVIAVLELRERVDVLPVFAWVHVQNRGAAFSFLAGADGWQRWLFALLAIGFSGWLLWELSRLRREERTLAVAYALVLGGAIGNLADRVLQGSVTDFVLVHWFDRAYFPAFNVADAAITVGAGLWILVAVLESRGGGGDNADTDGSVEEDGAAGSDDRALRRATDTGSVHGNRDRNRG